MSSGVPLFCLTNFCFRGTDLHDHTGFLCSSWESAARSSCWRSRLLAEETSPQLSGEGGSILRIEFCLCFDYNKPLIFFLPLFLFPSQKEGNGTSVVMRSCHRRSEVTHTLSLNCGITGLTNTCQSSHPGTSGICLCPSQPPPLPCAYRSLRA